MTCNRDYQQRLKVERNVPRPTLSPTKLNLYKRQLHPLRRTNVARNSISVDSRYEYICHSGKDHSTPLPNSRDKT